MASQFAICRALYTCEWLDLRGQPSVVSKLTCGLVAASRPPSCPHSPVNAGRAAQVRRPGQGSQATYSVPCSLEPSSSSTAHPWMPPSRLWSAPGLSTPRAWAWVEGSSSLSTMRPQVSPYGTPVGRMGSSTGANSEVLLDHLRVWPTCPVYPCPFLSLLVPPNLCKA